MIADVILLLIWAVVSKRLFLFIGISASVLEFFVVFFILRLFLVRVDKRKNVFSMLDFEKNLFLPDVKKLSSLLDQLSESFLVIYKGDNTRNVFIMICALIFAILIGQ